MRQNWDLRSWGKRTNTGCRYAVVRLKNLKSDSSCLIFTLGTDSRPVSSGLTGLDVHNKTAGQIWIFIFFLPQTVKLCVKQQWSHYKGLKSKMMHGNPLFGTFDVSIIVKSVNQFDCGWVFLNPAQTRFSDEFKLHCCCSNLSNRSQWFSVSMLISSELCQAVFSQMLENSLDGTSQCKWTMNWRILKKYTNIFFTLKK